MVTAGISPHEERLWGRYEKPSRGMKEEVCKD